MKSLGSLQIQQLNVSKVEPLLVIPWAIFKKIEYFVSKVELECQWFHTVTKNVDKNDPNKIDYWIDGFWIPPQTISAGEVETLGNGFIELMKEIKASFNNEREKFNPTLKTLSCWTHSHVNMPPNPSSTDKTTFETMIKDCIKQGSMQPQIMMIVNKKNELTATIFDPELAVILHNVNVCIEDPIHIDLSYIDAALKDKLSKKEFPTIPASRPNVYTGAGTNRGFHFSDDTQNYEEWKKLNDEPEKKKITDVTTSAGTKKGKEDNKEALAELTRLGFITTKEQYLTLKDEDTECLKELVVLLKEYRSASDITGTGMLTGHKYPISQKILKYLKDYTPSNISFIITALIERASFGRLWTELTTKTSSSHNIEESFYLKKIETYLLRTTTTAESFFKLYTCGNILYDYSSKHKPIFKVEKEIEKLWEQMMEETK